MPAGPLARDLAWAATLRGAALAEGAPDPRPRLPLTVQLAHLRRWWRTQRPGRLVLLVVDASGSMGPALVAIARRLAHAVLEDAYRRRDRVALIAFRGKRAELLCPAATRPERLETALRDLSFGGTTPLAAALERARRALARRSAAPQTRELLLLITDGRGNVGRAAGAGALRDEIAREAARLAARPYLRAVLLDATERGDDERPARWLATHLRARHVRLSRLREHDDPLAAIRPELEGATIAPNRRHRGDHTR